MKKLLGVALLCSMSFAYSMNTRKKNKTSSYSLSTFTTLTLHANKGVALTPSEIVESLVIKGVNITIKNDQVKGENHLWFYPQSKEGGCCYFYQNQQWFEGIELAENVITQIKSSVVGIQFAKEYCRMQDPDSLIGYSDHPTYCDFYALELS